MFDVTRLLIEQLARELHAGFLRTYGSLDPHIPEIAAWAADQALESIARSDATYHDVEHTVMVTSVGGELLRCLHLTRGGVTTSDWLHVILALLCHDMGYVRGICRRCTVRRDDPISRRFRETDLGRADGRACGKPPLRLRPGVRLAW